jgi:hypothetical protein
VALRGTSSKSERFPNAGYSEQIPQLPVGLRLTWRVGGDRTALLDARRSTQAECQRCGLTPWMKSSAARQPTSPQSGINKTKRQVRRIPDKAHPMDWKHKAQQESPSELCWFQMRVAEHCGGTQSNWVMIR